jgi:hypothetical protein
MSASLTALCIAIGACWISLVAIPANAWAGWLPAVAVKGPKIQQVVFGPNDIPWVTYEPNHRNSASPGPSIAHLTSDYGFADVHPGPHIPGMETTHIELALNKSGVGDVLLNDTPPREPEDKVPPNGVAISAWQPGRPVGTPIGLARETDRGPSIAIDPAGVAVVLWVESGETQTVKAASVRAGRLLGEQAITSHDGRVVNSVEVLQSPTGGFMASWELRSGGGGSAPFELVGVENAIATRDGAFSATSSTPWPLHVAGVYGVSEATLASDAHGDQVIAWTVGVDGGTGRKEELYAASRRAGGRFSTAQLVTEDASSLRPEIVIDPAGRITLMWQSAQWSKIMVTGGLAGHALETSRPLWVGSAHMCESAPQLALTTQDLAIAVWAVQRSEDCGTLGFAPKPDATTVAAVSSDGVHFRTPHRLSTEGPGIGGCGEPDILVTDRRGGAIAGWQCTLHGVEQINEYTRYQPG